MNREALANLRFGVHSGFKTDIAALPKSAQTQTSRLFGWGSSRQLHFIEKWFPGERLTVGLLKMSIL